MENDHICALIPAFNAESSLGEVIDRARKFIQRVIVVSDGSTDNTGAVARSHGVELITIPSNRGKGYALGLGFSHALTNGCRAIVTLDADGQHDPADIPNFLRAHDQDSGAILIGSRMSPVERFPRQIGLNTPHFQTEPEVLLRAARKGISLRSVPVKNIYGNGNAPKSNFRPVVDTFLICLVVLQDYLGIL